VLTHIVLFKLKDPSPPVIDKLKGLLLNMEGKVPQLQSIEVGVDVLRSERSYDVSLLTTFNSMEDMKAYQVHPLHKEVIEYVNEIKEATVCVDYEA
jgi:hypothetical protein